MRQSPRDAALGTQMNAITFSSIFTLEIHKSHSRMAWHHYQMGLKYPKAERRGYTIVSNQ